MTDSRLPARWIIDGTINGLSDRAWRTFTGSLMYANEAGTDGAIPRNALRFLHPEGRPDGATTQELIDAGLWAPSGDGIQVLNWEGIGQSPASAVEARKRAARDRQSNKRERERQRAAVTPDARGDVTRDAGRDVGQRQDRDRTGQASDAPDTAIAEWPTVVPGQARPRRVS